MACTIHAGSKCGRLRDPHHRKIQTPHDSSRTSERTVFVQGGSQEEVDMERQTRKGRNNWVIAVESGDEQHQEIILSKGRVSKHVSLIGSVAFCLGLLITSSPLEAQSSKASTSAETKHPILDSSFDPLQQVSASLQVLSKRVSRSVVQIFSTG